VSVEYCLPSPVVLKLCELVGVRRTGFVPVQCSEEWLILTIELAKLVGLVVAVGDGGHGDWALVCLVHGFSGLRVALDAEEGGGIVVGRGIRGHGTGIHHGEITDGADRE